MVKNIAEGSSISVLRLDNEAARATTPTTTGADVIVGVGVGIGIGATTAMRTVEKHSSKFNSMFQLVQADSEATDDDDDDDNVDVLSQELCR